MVLELTEPLAITLMTRFLNHLELLDTINNENKGEEVSVSDAMINEHADAVLRNLLVVGKYFGSHEDIKWIGNEKRKKGPKQEQDDFDVKETETETETETKTKTKTETKAKTRMIQTRISPLAFVVLIDKVGKIGRKAHSILLMSTCLKFYAALLISCPALTENINNLAYERAYLSILKYIDHVQTHTVSRDQVRKREWRSALELAGHLLDRIKSILGEDLHSSLNLKLVKSMSAARITRLEEKRRMDPELAAKIKFKETQKKYRARKIKSGDKNKSKKSCGIVNTKER